MRGLGVATLVAVAAFGSAAAEELRQPLSASVAFAAPDGAPLDRPEAGVPFTITVRIDNALGADPPAGLNLAGWLRPQSDSNLGCTEAARSFLATGRLPTGTIKLNGPLIGVAGQDGAFVVADPALDLASANLLGAATLAEAPASLTPDPGAGRMIATLEQAGEVLALGLPTAGVEVLADGLSRPVAAFGGADGAVWVHEAGAARLLRLRPGQAPQVLARDVTGMTRSAAEDTVAVAGAGGSSLFDIRSARLLFALDGATEAALPLADGGRTFALARLTGDGLSIHYADAPQRPVEMTLPSAVTRLAASPDGRWILGFDPGSAAPLLLIDVARSRVAQTITAGVPVSEIAFTGRAAYLMLADQSRVGVLDLAAINDKTAAALRNVTLGQPRADLLRRDGYLAPLWPQPGMLAVHAETFTGFVIHDYERMGDAPPMSALKLRGGIPARVAAYDRSFREIEPGVFRTTALLHQPGAYELVTTTGVGALSFCAALPAMDGTVAEAAPGHIVAERLAGEPAQVRLRFLTDDGKPVGNQEFRVLVAGLSTAWRAVTPLRSDAGGAATAPLPIPARGPVVIAVDGGDRAGFHPLVLE